MKACSDVESVVITEVQSQTRLAPLHNMALQSRGYSLNVLPPHHFPSRVVNSSQRKQPVNRIHPLLFVLVFSHFDSTQTPLDPTSKPFRQVKVLFARTCVFSGIHFTKHFIKFVLASILLSFSLRPIFFRHSCINIFVSSSSFVSHFRTNLFF